MRTFASGLLLLAVMSLCGCAIRSEFPVLPATTSHDASYSCAEIDDEIARANALRDAIYKEKWDQNAGHAAGVAVGAATSTTHLVVDVLMLPRHANRQKKYREAADATEVRLQHLLIYKRDRQCRPWTGADESTLSEPEVLVGLLDADRNLKAGAISDSQAAAERRRLLDRLR